MDPQKKIMDAQPMNGYFNDGSIADHGRNPNSDRFLFLDGSLAVAIETGEKPITSGAGALRASIKRWDADRNCDTSDRFFGREQQFDIQSFESLTLWYILSCEVPDEALKQRFESRADGFEIAQHRSASRNQRLGLRAGRRAGEDRVRTKLYSDVVLIKLMVIPASFLGI